ncbi:MAG: phosphoesterase, partial [Candidatus Eremiobacteraeota bacterium]|nr:phosphoesterase [Candidatus Eremiobacteraeota bacterium]
MRRVVACALALAWSVCMVAMVASAGAAAPAQGPTNDNARLAQLRQKIKYVFVIYQENRSFDSYFGTFPGADGFFSGLPREIPGFQQPLQNTDGSMTLVSPFRIGPEQWAADTDDVDHSHTRTVAKMNITNGVPKMDRFALVEEQKYAPSGNPSLVAKQMGELTMAYADCDTVPYLWMYARRFSLYDHVFESISGPSTPGNLVIIAAQAGITQWLLHPNETFADDGNTGPGVPVVNDADPLWGSPSDKSAHPMAVNPKDFPGY